MTCLSKILTWKPICDPEPIIFGNLRQFKVISRWFCVILSVFLKWFSLNQNHHLFPLGFHTKRSKACCGLSSTVGWKTDEKDEIFNTSHNLARNQGREQRFCGLSKSERDFLDFLGLLFFTFSAPRPPKCYKSDYGLWIERVREVQLTREGPQLVPRFWADILLISRAQCD